jgi:hypothetical protein
MEKSQKYRKEYNKLHSATEPIPNKDIHKTKIKQKQHCN